MTQLLSEELKTESRTIIALVLDGALRSGYSKKQFAIDCNISQQTISYIIAGERMPSPELAKQMHDVFIKQSLMSIADANDWLELVHLQAHLINKNTEQSIEQISEDSNSLILKVRQLYDNAKFHPDPKIAGRLHLMVLDIGKALRDHLNLINDDIEKVEVCFILHDLYSSLNRHVSALWAAHRADYLLRFIGKQTSHDKTERLCHHRINASRSVVVTLNNLGLYKQAYDCSLKIEELPEFKKNANFWKPHLYRDRLLSIARFPRFAISEAEGLAKQSWNILEHRAGNFDQLLHLLTTTSMASAFNAHNNAKKANRLLEKTIKTIDSIPNLGALHKVLVLRTYADSYWYLKNYDRWYEVIENAICVSSDAGLYHQQSEMRREVNIRMQ